MTAFEAATATGAAILAVFGTAIAPPVTIGAAIVSLLTSIGTSIVQGYADAATQDAVTEAVYTYLRSSSTYPSATQIGVILEQKFGGVKGQWFKLIAESIGDDLTARVLAIGALDPSNACSVYGLTGRVRVERTVNAPQGTFTLLINELYAQVEHTISGNTQAFTITTPQPVTITAIDFQLYCAAYAGLRVDGTFVGQLYQPSSNNRYIDPPIPQVDIRVLFSASKATLQDVRLNRSLQVIKYTSWWRYGRD